MTTAASRPALSWSARLLIALVLILAGAAAAVWALGHDRPAARFLGIVPAEVRPAQAVQSTALPQQSSAQPLANPDAAKVQMLEARIAQLENATRHMEGSAGRSDALVVTFAARRALERGVALGYLENLLVERFGQQHQRAVSTVITSARQPIRLNDLVDEYQMLGPELRSGGAQDGWWSNFRRELGSLVEVHSAGQPSTNPDARYNRALRQLSAGNVDAALTETMRMPGASRAQPWIARARRYIAAERALDELESAALLSRPSQAAPLP
jgi:hypothetical protein